MGLSATIENKSARINYNIGETYTAGLVLFGEEVRSLREGKANINSGWCYVTEQNEVYIKNMHITCTASSSFTSFNEDADRKLLLNKAEIKRIAKAAENKGTTIVPLKIFRAKNGLYKMLIGVAKGKKDYDKRDSIKERDTDRELARAMKNYV